MRSVLDKSLECWLMFQVSLALLCAVATCVLGAPDADPYGYKTYPEKIHKYGYTESKLVLPARRPWTYGGKNSPYGPLYTPDTFARRHYGVHRPALNAYRDANGIVWK